MSIYNYDSHLLLIFNFKGSPIGTVSQVSYLGIIYSRITLATVFAAAYTDGKVSTQPDK